MTSLKNISKNLKKSVKAALLVLLFVALNTAAIFGLGFAKTKSESLFASSLEGAKISISNPSFSSYSGSSPRTPSSWTKLVTDGSVIAGVVDIDDAKKDTESLKLKSDVAEYTGMSEDYVLLMNSPDTLSKMGYRSSEFTLEKNSYYVVSFKAYAENGAFASAYLSGEKLNARSDNYFNITTQYKYQKEVDDGAGGTTTETVYSSVWKDCYFLVETDEYFDTTATLDLRLGNTQAGSKGAVLFDNIQIQKLVRTDFNTVSASLINNNQCVAHTLSLKNTFTPIFVENFENANLTKWEKVKDCDADNAKALNGHTYLGNSLNETTTGITDSVSNQGLVDGFGNKNTGALFINNTEKLSVGYKLNKDNYLTIEQNKLYLLSFDAFTSSTVGDGAVKANIYAEKEENKFEKVASIDKISTSKEWKTYAFAINSNGFKNTKAYIEFWVENAEGYAVFDNLKAIEVSYELYSKYLEKNSETCKEADVSFAPATTLNNYFNKTYLKDGLSNNILNAQKWTSTVYDAQDNIVEKLDKNIGYAGVVNTANWQGLTFANPGDPNYKNFSTTSNNILVLNNVHNIKQTIKSENFTITKDKFYEISLDVKTNGLANAGIRVYNSNNKVIYEELFINENSWTTHTINVVADKEDTTIYFELSLGLDSKAAGVAFFDNLTTREITVSDKNVSYSEMFTTVNNNVVNLAKTDFANVDILSKNNGVFDARDWKYTKEAKVNAGVVDTENFTKVAQEFGVENPSVPTEILNASSKVFMIDSAFDSYFTVTADKNLKLDLDSYYKVTFWVNTQGVPASQEDAEYKYGASIKIVDASVKLGETFTGINTNGHWEKYELYLNTLTNDQAVENYNLNITLALGSEKLATMGTAYFSEITLDKIDQTQFETVQKEQEKTVNDKVITFVGSTTSKNTDADNDTETEPQQKGQFSFLYFSTILTAVVVLIAVIAFAVRSLHIKRPVRIKAADLNKERMSARNFAFKDKMIEVNNRLAVLDDELFETNKKLDDILASKNMSEEELQETKNKKAEILEKMKQVKQEEKELVEQFRRFKRDEKLRKSRSKNK